MTFIENHPYWATAIALVWGFFAGVIEVFVFQERPAWRNVPPVAYIVMAFIGFFGWPIVGVMWLFKEPESK